MSPHAIRAGSDEVRRLLEAACDGNLDAVREACGGRSPKQLGHWLRTVAVCQSGCTALHWAAGADRVAVVEYLVEEAGLDVGLPVAHRKSKGRTPLHYACRNGALHAARWLVETGGAHPDPRAKHGVTPFQLAVWQNRLDVCRWLVEEVHRQGTGGAADHDARVDPSQVNDFQCGAVHWLGICPQEDADLVPLARWLAGQPGVTFRLLQKQGHSALHKAAWGGHLAYLRYLHEEHDLWDDAPDGAGNYAADLADMAHTPRHAVVAEYLRQRCSRARADSCALLGLDPSALPLDTSSSDEARALIRRAYLERAKLIHPDRRVSQPATAPSTTPHGDEEDDNDEPFVSDGQQDTDAPAFSNSDFDALHKAYRHLMDQGGRGNQSNPAHSLKLMLEVQRHTTEGPAKLEDDDVPPLTTEEEDPKSLFRARLLAVILEYGHKGLDISNVKKKWKQVWPTVPFPDGEDGNDIGEGANGYPTGRKTKRKPPLSDFLKMHAGDSIELVRDEDRGIIRVFAKHDARVQATQTQIRFSPSDTNQ